MEPSALLMGGLSTIPSLPHWDAPMHRDPAYLLVELQYLRIGFAAPIACCRGVFPEDVAGDVAEAGWVRGVLGTGGRGPLGDLTAHRDQQVSASLGGLPAGWLGAKRQQQQSRQSAWGCAATPVFSLPSASVSPGRSHPAGVLVAWLGFAMGWMGDPTLEMLLWGWHRKPMAPMVHSGTWAP